VLRRRKNEGSRQFRKRLERARRKALMLEADSETSSSEEEGDGGEGEREGEGPPRAAKRPAQSALSLRLAVHESEEVQQQRRDTLALRAKLRRAASAPPGAATSGAGEPPAAAEAHARVAGLLGMRPRAGPAPGDKVPGTRPGRPGVERGPGERAKASRTAEARFAEAGGMSREHKRAISLGVRAHHERRRVASELGSRRRRMGDDGSGGAATEELMTESVVVEMTALRREIAEWIDAFEAKTGIRPGLDEVADFDPGVYRKFLRLMGLTEAVRARRVVS